MGDTATQLRDVLLPDIGDFDAVDVVEILVAPGDSVALEQALVVLESDKAQVEVPAPFAGEVVELCVAIGDKVGEGARIAVLRTQAEAEAESTAPEEQESAEPEEALVGTPNALAPALPPAINAASGDGDGESTEAAEQLTPVRAHASPSVRLLARELGVDLTLVPGSGRKARVTKEDVQRFVKASLQTHSKGVPIAGVSVAAPLEIDFSKWGEIEMQALNRIRKLSSANLHRSWVTVPHVTQCDEADITELDAFRKAQQAQAQKRGIKLTFLPFAVKAAAAALREFPHFNASLDPTGEHLIVKRYIHIGVAVDTENGLVVPVIRDADQKGLFALAEALADLSERARARRLRPQDLQGGSFSISSLGGIGGSFFTPIVNHPEVAILGISKMQWKPLWRDGKFVPRLVLPLSLSYDHRVIDGADAVRFTTHLASLLGDLRRLLL